MIKLGAKYSKALSGKRFIDLFSGIGGFRLALESFGATCTFSSEIDNACRNVYRLNFGDYPSSDIRKIKAKDVPKHDILCAGFPCQSFSISGKQLGFEDSRGILFYDICRILEFHDPQLVILENVKNLNSHDGGRTITTIVKKLLGLDYHVWHDVLNSSLFGIPQARERTFLVCTKNKDFEFEAPSPSGVYLRDVLEDDPTPFVTINIKRFPYRLNDEEPKPRLKPIRIGHINQGRQGERIYHPNGHAITLSSGGGGIGARTGMYKVGNTIRRLTPRECAKVNGFPDTFRIHATMNQCYRQFGNSIVVDVVQCLVKSYVDQFIL